VQKLILCCFWRALLVGFALMPAMPSFGAPVISEFMAANKSGLTDEDGDFSDWIEVCNPDSTPVSLAGYHLTDNAANLGKWTFPAVTLNPRGYMIIFASGKNRTDPAGRLHTSFKLSAGGEYLGLVAPDGLTVVSAYAPAYPPQFENVSFGLDQGKSPPVWCFFITPTPGAPNTNGTPAGPIVSALEPNPAQPVTGPLTITARLLPVNGPVATVSLYYRRMFGAETLVPMRDDGTGGDAVAGDGIWTAVIPAAAFGPGEMTRWRFAAIDSQGAVTKEPAFRDPLNSDQYFGTVPQDARIQTALPVYHWFTSNPAGAETSTGSRGSIYYEGEFYDNVFFKVHGQSSLSFPKKSYNLNFNHTHRFCWSTNAPRVKGIDLLTNWADKSKVRNVLAYEIMRLSGVATHFAYTVRVQQNGGFYSTADCLERGDDIYLERAGLNQDGALYKIYNNLLDKNAGDTGNSGVEKKTRKSEDNSDLQGLIDGLALTGQALTDYVYDNIDIPRCVDLIAATCVIRNLDMGGKNWYIYRDTGRSGEWAMLPWDLDLSAGRVWDTQYTYFDNALYTDDCVVNSTAIRLVSYLFSNQATRAMIMRRIRTLSDQFLQPLPAAGTPESQLYYERRLNEQSALIDPPDIVPSDALRDFEKWGSWLPGGAVVPYSNTNAAVETMAKAIGRWKTEYLPGRRKCIYNTQTAGHGGEIPAPQTGGDPTTNYTPLVVTGAPVKALVPANGSLGETWTGYPAFEPFNTSNWMSGVTGVGYERATGYETLIGLNVGTQMQSNNSVYTRIEFEVSDPAAYDLLQLRLKFDDGFVAFLNGALLASAWAPTALLWDSTATALHRANPNAFTLYEVTAKLGNLLAGRNILAIQGLRQSPGDSDMIILPELYGGKVSPASTLNPRIDFGAIEVNPASGNPDEQFIELENFNTIAVDISNWRLTGGFEHTFLGGTVLPPGGAIYVSPNAAAFRARAVSPKGGQGLLVQGDYQGHFSNFAETLMLLDPSGATNNTTAFPVQASDVQRYLVISEIMYHPAGDGLAEFIELLNISGSVTLDLRGVRFTKGVKFDFITSAITWLAPGARVLVVRDLAAFTAAYGTNLPVAGVFENGTALNNGGEVLKLEDAGGGTIEEFAYANQAPWPTSADAGYSLVLIAPETNPDPSVAANWRASVRPGGSPGWPDVEGFPADPTGDANGNGEPDLVDYVLGNDLGLPQVLPRVTLQPDPLGGPQTVQLSYPISLSAQDAEVGVSFSTDLITWQDAAAGLELVSRQRLDDKRDLVTWRVEPPLRDEPRVFLRLRAVAH